MRAPSYSPEQKAEVLSLLDEGQTYKAIAAKTGLTVGQVDAIRKKGKKAQADVVPLKIKSLRSVRLEETDTLTPFELWLSRWEKAYAQAEESGQTSSMISLLSQYASRLVERQQTEPITIIQPVEYSYVLPAIRINELAHDIAEAMIDVIRADVVAPDDAQRVLNALSKQFPTLEVKD
jgi:hypothetical protein